MRPLLRQITVLLSVVLMTACINPKAVNQRIIGKGWYQVKPTDTLYSIAWRYGLDHQTLARWNQIEVSSIIYPGQRLLLVKPNTSTQAVVANQKTQKTVARKPPKVVQPSTRKTTTNTKSKVSSTAPSKWQWPTEGTVLSTFSLNKLDRRGIDIGGKIGQPIRSVAAGKVVYSGNGLAGYGNLIIIKHSDSYLSAYAYSQERLVHEGMVVKPGQMIAKMGRHKSQDPRLHFQIRKNGKPVNPLQYLPKR